MIGRVLEVHASSLGSL